MLIAVSYCVTLVPWYTYYDRTQQSYSLNIPLIYVFDYCVTREAKRKRGKARGHFQCVTAVISCTHSRNRTGSDSGLSYTLWRFMEERPSPLEDAMTHAARAAVWAPSSSDGSCGSSVEGQVHPVAVCRMSLCEGQTHPGSV